MYGIIIATHGNFASGIYSGFKLICGDLPNVKVVDFVEGDTTDILDNKLKQAYDELKDYDRKLILTDLAGGSPFTRAVMLFGEEDNVRVLSGLSFPLLYLATMTDNQNIDEDVQSILEEAKATTIVYAPTKKEEEVASDGI